MVFAVLVKSFVISRSIQRMCTTIVTVSVIPVFFIATVMPGGTPTRPVTTRLPDIRRVMAQGILRIVAIVVRYRRSTIVMIVVVEAMIRVVVVNQMMQVQVVRPPTDAVRRRHTPEPA